MAVVGGSSLLVAKLDNRSSTVEAEGTMAEEVSVLRLYVLRAMYLLNCALAGSGVVVQFIHRPEPWGPIAYSADCDRRFRPDVTGDSGRVDAV